MRLQLCIDARMLFSSGIGTYLQKIIPRMQDRFDTTLLVQRVDRPWVEEHLQCKVICIDSPIYSLQEQITLPLHIPPSDLFWSPHYNVPWCKIRAKKRVVTIHDVCHLAMTTCFPKWKQPLAYCMLKQAVRKSDLVLTVSEFSRREIASFLPISEQRIQVVMNGVENRLDTKSGKEPTRPFILYVGNLKPHKNIDRLLQAFFLLPDRYDLVLVSPRGQALHIPKHPRVKQLYEIPEEELCLLYKTACLLIQPSLYEGFGLTPLEAMSLGCPVVAALAGSLPEVCGDGAYYVDPYDEKDMCRGMLEVLENRALCSALIAAGHARVKHFSWDKTAENIMALFTEGVYAGCSSS